MTFLSAEKLAVADSCLRRAVWTERYQLSRISPIGALYRALDAGLRADKSPERAAENEFMALAANPGLDIQGRDVYAVAMHYSKLAGIVAEALRSAFAAPWSAFPDSEIGEPRQAAYPWRSSLYDAGNGIPRRVVLVDRWGDGRMGEEVRSWRTLGESCVVNKPILLTAVVIGASKDGRRHSAWTRCYRHPKNRTIRFKRKNAVEDFAANWEPMWRESSEIPTKDWLAKMQQDEVFSDLVQTAEVPVPPRRDAFVREIARIGEEVKNWEARPEYLPPMRLAGCYRFTPCPFLEVCFGGTVPLPENYNFALALKSAIQQAKPSSTESVRVP